jgi:phage-related protein
VSLAIPGGASSQLVFNGTMAASNPITVDYNQGTIIDAVGANRFGMIQAGSKMTNLQPGLNTISVVAENWGVGPHVVTWWRDARK